MTEILAFIRFKPCKIRLIVRITACHKLGILSVAVGKRTLPRVGELGIRPRKHFLSGRNVSVGDMDNSRARALVVSAEEIKLRLRTEI